MKITSMFKVETQSNIATGEEIATLVVNLNAGLLLKELKAEESQKNYLNKKKNLQKLMKFTKKLQKCLKMLWW